MTHFNKGPAYGLSAEVRSKVSFPFLLYQSVFPENTRSNGVLHKSTKAEHTFQTCSQNKQAFFFFSPLMHRVQKRSLLIDRRAEKQPIFHLGVWTPLLFPAFFREGVTWATELEMRRFPFIHLRFFKTFSFYLRKKKKVRWDILWYWSEGAIWTNMFVIHMRRSPDAFPNIM